MSNKESGDTGEKEVCELVPCPNCDSTLTLLPPSFPLADIQCSRCQFRAQVKTISGKPSDSILGAGYDIYEKVFKAGYLLPPLFANFKWTDKLGSHQEIRFYPFIGKKNVKAYTLSDKAVRAGYRMFRYVGLQSAPHVVMYGEH